MRKLFSIKLCPLLSLALATMGCGKKLNESNGSSQGSQTTERQELPSAMIIKLDLGESKKIYNVSRNANIILPDALLIREGIPSEESVVISYNLQHGNDPDGYDYQCTYRSTGATNILPLKHCMNSYGEIFTDISRFSFPINYGRYIRMDRKGPSGFALDAVYTVDWI